MLRASVRQRLRGHATSDRDREIALGIDAQLEKMQGLAREWRTESRAGIAVNDQTSGHSRELRWRWRRVTGIEPAP